MAPNLAWLTRRSPRLKGWDYTEPGKYYVTITTECGVCWFGNVLNDEMQYSKLGEIARDYWLEIPKHQKQIDLDEFIVMPNHVHGILILSAKSAATDVQLNVRTKPKEFFSALSPKKGSLSVVIRTYKAAVTTWARENGIADFGWHGRFHDHIIRNEEDYGRVAQYVKNNVRQWQSDEENPANAKLKKTVDA